MFYKSIFNAVAVVVVFLMVFGVYAQTKSTPTVSTFKDSRDGKTYKKVTIGGKTWMAENLNYAANSSVCYGNNAGNCEKYGRLYNWATAKTACPAGWHLPNNAEWTQLTDFVGGKSIAGMILKSSAGWNDDEDEGTSGNGTNEYLFSALPGGYWANGDFGGVGNYGLWWSLTENNVSSIAWSWGAYYNGEDMAGHDDKKENLLSVRCVQD